MMMIRKIFHHLDNWREGDDAHLQFTAERYGRVYEKIAHNVKELQRDMERGPAFDDFRAGLVESAR
jgi:hypothetical protein